MLVVGNLLSDGAGPTTTQAPNSLPSADRTVPASSIQPTTMPGKFMMNFKDIPIDAVLGFVSQHAGLQILKDEPIDVRVTIMSKEPISGEEAIDLLAAALKGNGFAVIRSGQVLHIISREKARKGNVPVHFGNDPAEIADTDELITQVISVDNVSATKLLSDLKPMISETDIVANEGSNSIIVTDTSATVKRLVTIVATLDKHEATTAVVRVRVLKHCSAVAAAKLIDTLFKGSVGAAAPQNPRQMQPGQPGPPPDAATSERHGSAVVTAADERTNTLLVMASNGMQKMIDEVLDRLDADNPNPAPATELRSYLLRFAQADDTARLLNNVYKQPASNNGYQYLFLGGGDNSDDKKAGVNAVADDRSNTVVVSAPSEKFKEIDALIQKLDSSPMASTDLRVIHLKYADADDVAKMVTDMFSPKKSDQSDSPFRLLFLGSDPNASQPKGTTVNVSSDLRTNTLLVSAPTPVLDSIEKIVKQLDSDPSSEDTMFIYHLRNGQASHLEYTLNVLFGNVGSQGQNNQQNGNGQNGQQPGGLSAGLNQPQNNRQTFGNNNGPGNSQSNSSNRQRNQNNQRSGSQNANPAKATNELTGEVLVVADPDTNSLLVTTASKFERQVKAIITELDRPVPQVLIKCLVAEVTHDDALNYGTDFSVIDIHANGNGGSVGNTVGAAAAALGLTTPPGIVAKVIDNDLRVTLQALAQANKLDVLSRPYILTSDNQDANITVGNEVPFVTDSFTDSTGGTHSNFQYQDIGIILDVTPHINPDGLVVMDVDPQISSLTGQTVTVQQGVNVPVYELRSASSRVAIKDGQTIVIGGLMQDQKTDHVSKIPLLGDIPLLGQLFQYHSNDKSKTELLIFLTPHVIPLPEELKQSTNDETRGTTLTPKAVGPGVFDEHMRGMHRGEVPQIQPNGAPANPIRSTDTGTAATTQLQK